MPADMQVCNCNGVTKAAIGACVAAGKRSTQAVMDATRAGKGCGSCKGLVGDLVAWLCGGEIEDDPSIHYYVPSIPLRKPELVQGHPRAGAQVGVGGVQGARPAASRTRRASRRWRRCSVTIWNKDYEDERDARFINDRVHANIQKDGTFSVIPGDAGRRLHAGGAAADRRCRREIQCAAGQGHRRTAHRSCRRAEGSSFPMSGGSRHAGGTRLGQELSHLQELHRHRLLPFRPGRQHGAGAQDRTAFPRHRQSGQAQARHRRLPAQLLGGADQGRRRGRDRRRQVGNLHRRRRRLARAQGRPALRRRQRRRCAALHRPLHAVLPREREVQGTDLHLCRAGRDRAHSRRRGRRQRRHRRRASMPRCRRRSRRPTIPGRRRRRRRPRTSLPPLIPAADA